MAIRPTPSPPLAVALSRRALPAAVERRVVVVAPGETVPTSAAAWAGALVLVDRGAVEVECLAGGRRTFGRGDLLLLGCLPLWAIHNRGSTEARLLAVRRRSRCEA